LAFGVSRLSGHYDQGNSGTDIAALCLEWTFCTSQPLHIVIKLKIVLEWQAPWTNYWTNYRKLPMIHKDA
jgi:hypothetical protein